MRRVSIFAATVWFVAATCQASVLTDNLRITEIMYHPGDPSAAELAAGFADPELFEFIEVVNIGPSPLDLTDFVFEGGVSFTFGTMTLPAMETVLVVNSQAAFEHRYGSGLNIAGEFSGNLSNGGEQIRLDDPAGQSIHDFTYDDSWHPTTDGGGHSLTIRDVLGPLSAWNEVSGWGQSAAVGGSPGIHGEVPETSSLLTWGLLATLAVVAARRRKRQSSPKGLPALPRQWQRSRSIRWNVMNLVRAQWPADSAAREQRGRESFSVLINDGQP